MYVRNALSQHACPNFPSVWPCRDSGDTGTEAPFHRHFCSAGAYSGARSRVGCSQDTEKLDEVGAAEAPAVRLLPRHRHPTTRGETQRSPEPCLSS